MPAFVYHLACSLLELFRKHPNHGVVINLSVITYLKNKKFREDFNEG
jgi:hypothetical protein